MLANIAENVSTVQQQLWNHTTSHMENSFNHVHKFKDKILQSVTDPFGV